MSQSFINKANSLLAKLDKMTKEERLAWVEKKMEAIGDSDHIINDLDKSGLLNMSEIHFAPKASYEVEKKSEKNDSSAYCGFFPVGFIKLTNNINKAIKPNDASRLNPYLNYVNCYAKDMSSAQQTSFENVKNTFEIAA